MTHEEQLRADFADDTAYERLVLTTLRDPGPAPPGALHARDDLRGERQFHYRGDVESISAEAIAKTMESFRPLTFGAAYKVIDFLVEMAMRLNGRSGGRLTFKQKESFATKRAPTQLPAPLDGEPYIWPRIAATYACLVDHRHVVVHRTTVVLPDGSLGGLDPSGIALRPFAVGEQKSLADLARNVSEAVIAGHASGLLLNETRWNLDQLAQLHGMPILGADEPAPVVRVVVVDVEPVADGRWRIDGARLHEHLRRADVAPINADVEVQVRDGGVTQVFVAQCTEVPDGIVDVDENSLPKWLRSV